MSVPAPILATKFDTLRNQEMPGARLFLFEQGGVGDRRYTPIEFDPAKEPGQVLRGWRVNPRRFDRFGDPFLQVQIARTKIYTAEMLSRVAGFCIIRRRETTAFIHKCAPAGQARLASEPVWRFTSQGETKQTHGDVSELLLSDGSSFLLLADGESKLKLAS